VPEVGGRVDDVMGQAGSENFSVASILLPRRFRRHLLAIYGYCRYVDDVGDELEGDRTSLLDAAERELDAAMLGAASQPIFIELERTIQACNLDRKPLADLIDANRLDQTKHRYATFVELESYCALSANPVGRLVLAVFGVANDVANHLSDHVCTALQVVEHLQDVGEDFVADRVYLPQADLDRFGVRPEDLGATTTSPALRRAVAFESSRAVALLEAGSALTGYLSGAGRVAVAGFIGGGLAQLEALRSASYDVLGQTVKASKYQVASFSLRQLLHAVRR
jgi:squalene synthase HpnC